MALSSLQKSTLFLHAKNFYFRKTETCLYPFNIKNRGSKFHPLAYPHELGRLSERLTSLWAENLHLASQPIPAGVQPLLQPSGLFHLLSKFARQLLGVPHTHLSNIMKLTPMLPGAWSLGNEYFRVCYPTSQAAPSLEGHRWGNAQESIETDLIAESSTGEQGCLYSTWTAPSRWALQQD